MYKFKKRDTRKNLESLSQEKFAGFSQIFSDADSHKMFKFQHNSVS